MTALSKVRTPSFSQRLNSVRQKSDETPAVSTTSVNYASLYGIYNFRILWKKLLHELFVHF